MRGVLMVPRQALVQRNGQSVVCFRGGGRIELWEVNVTARTEGGVAMTFNWLLVGGIGLIFGVYPAVRATRLDPVYALHDE